MLGTIEQLNVERLTLEELQTANYQLMQENAALRSKHAEMEKITEQFLSIKNAINVPLLLIDTTLQVQRANRNAMTRFELPSASGLAFSDYMPDGQDNQRVADTIQKVIETGQTQELRTEFKGCYYWVQCSPCFGQNNIVNHVVVLYIDETHRIESERKLYDSMERYKALSMASDIPIYIKDKDGRFLAANTALQQLLGLDEPDILGRSDADFFPENEAKNFSANDALVRTTRKTHSFEEEYINPQNERITYLSIKAPLMDTNGEVYATSGISIDISEKRNTLEELALYKSVIDNANDVIIITKADELSNSGPEILYVNQAFCKLSGYSAEEAKGRTPRIMQGEKTDKLTLSHFKEALKAHKPFGCELVNYSKSGDEYMLEINTFPVKDLHGKVKYFAAIQRDITERNRYERELEATNEKIIRASNAKSEFLANMSHEIRTPMNAICGIADLLNNYEIDAEKQQDFHKKLGVSAAQLKELIDDILDFSKLEANQLDIERQPFVLADMMEEIRDIHSIKAQQKGLDLVMTISTKLAVRYMGDRVRIKQILHNLISNAIKFTDAGSVTLHVDKDAHHAGNLAFIVSDTGIGIPEDQQQKVFSKFAQGGIELDRKIGGTGLGLSISKSLAEAMEGSITLKSELGKGTCFTLHIPLLNAIDYNATKHHEIVLGKNDVLLPYPVLIVEDTQTNVDVITTYLQQANIAFEVAYSGVSAIEKLKSQRYSVILMDLQMSGMDGFTTVQHIRNLPQEEARDIPIIVVTAHAEESIRKKCLKANMSDFITKPIDNQLLLRTLKKFECIA